MSRLETLGITVLGDFILSEGIDSILDNLTRIGTTAVAVNPTVTAPSDEEHGSFQPPSDAGSSPRLFDRPLFGKRALWVRSGVSYEPNAEFYKDSAYAPRRTNDLTAKHGAVIGEFIDRAVDAGMEVWFQIGAVQPSGLRDEDKPRLPDGTIPPNRMANTGSLASEAVRSFNRAYIKDLVEAYPKLTGFRPDWPEYPCYTPGEVFQDFGEHVRLWAGKHGFDFDSIQADVARFWNLLHGKAKDRTLSNADFEREWMIPEDLSAGLREWLRLKAALSVDILAHWREAIDDAAGSDCRLSANAFMPHYTTLTGFDFAGAADICEAVSPKLYTMHWSLMVEFWAKPILESNPQLDEESVVGCLVRLMDIAEGDDGGSTLEYYGYPAPDEPHPIPNAPQERKLKLVADRVAGKCRVTPLVHGYGPVDDFHRRLEIVAASDSADGLWINRYGYLGDDKLRAIGEVAR